MEFRSRDVFAWTISKGSSRQTEFVNDVVQFGDGYEQVVARGINAQLRTWDLLFTNRHWTEIRAIEDWLRAHAGRIPFYFIPEDTGLPVLVRTEGAIQVSIENNVEESLSCTFKEWRGG